MIKKIFKNFEGEPEPRVSVVIPCYNYGRFLPECLQSLAQQTYRDFEVIIVNDGSTDDSLEIAKEMLERYRGRLTITLLDQENRGLSGARNRGFSLARGCHFFALDPDDMVVPDFLAKTTAALEEQPEIHIVYPGFKHFEAQKYVFLPPDFDLEILKYLDFIPYCSLYRREVFQSLSGYDEGLPAYEDWDFWLRAAGLDFRFQPIKEPLLLWRRHQTSMLATLKTGRELAAKLRLKNRELFDELDLEWARKILDTDELPSYRGKMALIIADHFYPSMGGLESFCANLGFELSRLGYATEVATLDLRRDCWYHNGINIYEFEEKLGPYGVSDKPKYQDLKRLIDSSDYELIIIKGDVRNWATWSLPSLENLPSILVLTVNRESVSYLDANPELKRAYVQRLRQARLVISESFHGYDRKFLQENDIPHQVIPPAANYISPSTDFRRNLGIPQGKKLVIAVGSYCNVKNQLWLVEALKRMPGDWVLVSMGKDFEPGYLQAVRERAVGDARFIILGPQSEEVVASAMEQADLLVIPSLAESFGIVALEAMSHRLPWVASEYCSGLKGIAGGTLAPLQYHLETSSGQSPQVHSDSDEKKYAELNHSKTVSTHKSPEWLAKALKKLVIITKGKTYQLVVKIRTSSPRHPFVLLWKRLRWLKSAVLPGVKLLDRLFGGKVLPAIISLKNFTLLRIFPLEPFVSEVHRLLEDPIERKRLGDEGYRQWRDNYTYEKVALKYLEVAGLEPSPESKVEYRRNIMDPCPEPLRWLRSGKRDHPLVSVIIPTFNRPHLLKEAVQSVLDQTYRNLEAIVVNDAGVDVRALVESYGDPRLRYHSNHRRSGLASARNQALSLASGKYIAYLDDDDIYYPSHVETLVEALEGSDYKVAYADAFRTVQLKQGDEWVRCSKDLLYHYDFSRDLLFARNYIPILTVMHHRECLDKVGYFDQNLPLLEDWDMLIRMASHYEFLHIKRVTGEFRSYLGKSQMTKGSFQRFQQTTSFLDEKYGGLISKSREKIRRELSNWHWGSPEEIKSQLLSRHAREISNDEFAAKEFHALKRRYGHAPAMRFLRERLARQPAGPFFYYLSSHAFLEEGDLIEALECLRLALESVGNSPPLLNDLAVLEYFLSKEGGRPTGLLEGALSLNEHYWKARLNLAEILLQSGEREKAQLHLERLKKDDISEEKARLRIARLSDILAPEVRV